MMSQFDDSEGNRQLQPNPGPPQRGSQSTNVLRGCNVAVRAGDFFKAFSTSSDCELEETPTQPWEPLNVLADPKRLRWKEQALVNLSLCRAGERPVVLFDFDGRDAAHRFASGLPNIFQEQPDAREAILRLVAAMPLAVDDQEQAAEQPPSKHEELIAFFQEGLRRITADQLDSLQLKPAPEAEAQKAVGDGEGEGQSPMIQKYRERIKEEKAKMAARKVPSVDRSELAKAYRQLASPLEPQEREELERRMNREAAADEELE